MVARVFVSRDLPGKALQRLAASADTQIWDQPRPPSADDLIAAIADCDGLLCMLTDRIDAGLLNAAPELRVISSYSVGVDHVDVEALNKRRIPLGHTPHVLTDATADLTMALLLAASRRLNEAEQFVREGVWTPQQRWEPSMFLGRDMRGANLGLLGLGPIGQAVARRAAGFGMRILGWTPSGRSVPYVDLASFDEVIEQADFLSLHLALAESTRHIINAEVLQRMPRKAMLINTARGPLIDESALIVALKNKDIAGAALDVFEQEPIAGDHPLLALPQVCVTPHIGSATWNTRCAMADLAVDNLLAGLRGETMPHCVNPEFIA